MVERAQLSVKNPEVKRENKASQMKKTSPSQSISSPVEQILFLQRTIGNQAVGRLFKSGSLQAKLRIGQPGDIYEHEADRVAERVMRMHQPKKKKEKEILQTKEATGSTPEVTHMVENSISTLRGGGQPLPESARAFYEPRFGADFSGVRVHTGSHAAETAGSINARAFTVGNNIAFGGGQFAPGSQEGRKLLAHELTHVLQQSGATAAVQETPDDPLSRRPIMPLGTVRVQPDWLDDVKAAVSDTYDSASSGVSGAYGTVTSAAGDAYDTAASTVGTVTKKISDGVKVAVSTVSSAGQAVGSYASDIGKTLKDDPEKTRANLISQVNATRQKVKNSNPDSVTADASQIASLNQHISNLNAAMSSAAIPAILPILVPIGEVILDILGVIIAALLGATAATILIIAIIILAIIALIIYLLRDTRKFPDPDTKTDPKDKTNPKDKTDPKEEPDPKGKPDDRPPPPPPLPPDRRERKPDCCDGPTPRGEFEIKDKKHIYFRPGRVDVKDNRNKHTRNIKPTNGARCDVEFLRSVVSKDPNDFGPCLAEWITAAKIGDTRKHGSQMGSDTIGNYVGKVEDIVIDMKNKVKGDNSTWFGDTGEPLGVDISNPGAPTITNNARVDDAPAKAHIIPIEDKP